MNDPQRLLNGETAGFSRHLLQAAQDERPSAELSAKMLVGVSAGVATGLSGASAKAASQSVVPPAPPLGTVATKSYFGAKVAGAVGVGAVVLTAALSGVFSEPEPDPPPVQQRSEQVLFQPQLESEEALPREAESSTFAVENDASLDESPEPTAVREKTVVKRTDLLKQELSLLESARKKLAEKRPADALSLLQRYSYRFPSGKLAQEATVLRVEALKAQGETAEAADLSKEFLRDNPDSAHKRRLDQSSPQK